MNIARLILAAVLGIGLLEATQATDRYVSLTGGNASPYTSWPDAATNIQYAISACSSGDVVWVTNGTYEVGGVIGFPLGTLLTNRVAITTAYVTVRSAHNDPTNTIIKGAWASAGTTNGPDAVRCVFMTNKTSLIGFTLTNGATLASGAARAEDTYGGGIYASMKPSEDWSTTTMISNCVIVGNSATGAGAGSIAGNFYNCTLRDNVCFSAAGGVYEGILFNCTLSGNRTITSAGGGAYGGKLYNCMIVSNRVNTSSGSGGGVSGSTLTNCTLIGNVGRNGGGAYSCTMYSCLLAGNQGEVGGGANLGTLYNCTVVRNKSTEWNENSGGGVVGGVLYNCIVYANTNMGTGAAGKLYENWRGAVSFTNCCTWPTATVWAVGNITNDPMFVDSGSGYGTNAVGGNYRLSAGSPCINAGTNGSWTTNTLDLDGRIRIRYGTVDMGAYEKFYSGTIYSFR